MKIINASVGLFAMLAAAGGCLAETDEATEAAPQALAATTWFSQSFDAYGVGPLAGQGGWTTAAGDSSCVVFPVAGFGNMAKCTPQEGSGQRESSTRAADPQALGSHMLRFTVRANGEVTTTTAAKLTLNAVADGSIKILQIFAGRGLRMTSGTGATVWLYNDGDGEFVNQPIDVACTFSLDAHTASCLAGPHGGRATRRGAVNLASNATTIASLDLFAWDVPGAVLFDDIVGTRQ